MGETQAYYGGKCETPRAYIHCIWNDRSQCPDMEECKMRFYAGVYDWETPILAQSSLGMFTE